MTALCFSFNVCVCVCVFLHNSNWGEWDVGGWGGVTVTYSSQQTLGLLDGAITAKEANHHHDGTDTNQDVDT